MTELPRIISVDDHVIDPPTLWLDRLPKKYHDRAPRVVRKRVARIERVDGRSQIVESDDAKWADIWLYDDLASGINAAVTSFGEQHGRSHNELVTYDEISPGCWQQAARLADMDLNWTDAQLTFPQFPRFSGQTFNEREDKDFALLCLKAYNDFIIDEWCGGDGYGRLLPLTIIPLWDPDLAAAEIRRCADKGAHAVTFPECPPNLGLPSLYSGYWEPFVAACAETDTVVNLHVGSSSKLFTTADDAPIQVAAAMVFVYNAGSLIDWLLSGILARYPDLRIAMSEGQVGWMPYMLERIDSVWERSAQYDPAVRDAVPEPPSSYVPGRVYGCIFDDAAGLYARDLVGMTQIMFETDYPHGDSTFPNTRKVLEKLVAAAGLNDHETWQLVRGNAIDCYHLNRYGITH